MCQRPEVRGQEQLLKGHPGRAPELRALGWGQEGPGNGELKGWQAGQRAPDWHLLGLALTVVPACLSEFWRLSFDWGTHSCWNHLSAVVSVSYPACLLCGCLQEPCPSWLAGFSHSLHCSVTLVLTPLGLAGRHQVSPRFQSSLDSSHHPACTPEPGIRVRGGEGRDRSRETSLGRF